MRRTLIRVVSFGAVLAVLAGAASTAALADRGHARFGGPMGIRGGFGPGGMMPGGFGFGFGGPGFGFGGRLTIGGPGGPGGGILGADVLTPAASFLNLSLTKLESDLAGGKTLAQEATANNKTAADLITAIVNALKTNLDNEKAAGWITADQETALVNRLTDAVTELVNNGPPVPRDGLGHGGLLQTAATYLGISVSDLQADLKSGKSLADVVKTVNGKTVDGLVAALEAPTKSHLDQAVTDGKITQAQETAILDRLTTQLTNIVNNTKPAFGAVQKNLMRFAALRMFARHH